MFLPPTRRCYHSGMSGGSNQARLLSAEEEAAERAARVRSMLERWAAEDVSGEPEWDVSDVAPLSLRDDQQ